MKGIELLKLINEGKIEKGCKFNIIDGALSPVEWDDNDFRYEGVGRLSIETILDNEFEPVKEIKHENIIKEEIQSLTIRDYLIDDLIRKNALELKQKIIKKLDEKLDTLGKILSERTDPKVLGFENIGEAKEKYNKIVKIRKTIKVTEFEDFIKLNQQDIVKSLCEIYEINQEQNEKVSFGNVLFEIGML